MTTDNPRELRAIAQRIEMECDTIIRHGLDAMPAEDQANTIALINDRLALAEYALATVRDDDGEEQPDTWVGINDGKGTVTVTRHGVFLRTADTWGHIPMLHTRPTRGQFRALCRGLGIEVTG